MLTESLTPSHKVAFLFHLKLAQSRVPMFPIAHTSRDRGVSLRVCQTQCYQLSETRRDQMKACLGAGRRGCAGITCVVRTGPPASPLLWKQEDKIPFPTGVGAGTRSSRSTARLCSSESASAGHTPSHPTSPQGRWDPNRRVLVRRL